MLRRVLVFLTAAVVAALIGLWLCDGPLWRLTLPATVPAAIRPDVARLHSWRGSTRAWACRNLASGGAAAAPFVIEHADDNGPDLVEAQCVQALEAMGPAAVPTLIDALNTNPRERIRHVAAELLGDTHDPRALDHLHLAMFDASMDVRAAVIDSLAAFCDPKIVKWSRAMAQADDPSQRVDAIRRLGKCESPDVVPDLEQALQDPEAAVAREAEHALRRRHLR